MLFFVHKKWKNQRYHWQKIKTKKLKTPKIINKIFGIGGEISYKNIKRNKRKYRTTTISIAVSVLTFIALSTFIGLAFDATHEITNLPYNIQLFGEAKNQEAYNKILKTTNLDGIKDYTIEIPMTAIIKNVKYTEEYKKELDMAQDIEKEINKNSGEWIPILAINKEQYQKYIKTLNLDYDKIKDKGILINKFIIERKNKKKKVEQYNYKTGEKLEIKFGSNLDGMTYIDNTTPGKTIDLEIGKITEELPFGIKTSIPILIISEELYETNKMETQTIQYINCYYLAENPDKLQDNIEQIFLESDTTYSIFNANEQYQMMHNLFILVAIFLYGFITVISLNGITNIFNTITTNMQLRKQEFAMLKSIGMTNKQFKQMLDLECIFYGTKALLYGLPLGILVCYLLNKAFSDMIEFMFKIPWNSIIICVIAIYTVVYVTMVYASRKVKKENIIDVIRDDNI